jgi:hypothetical protein
MKNTTVAKAMTISEKFKVQYQGYGNDPEFALVYLPENMKAYNTQSWFIHNCDSEGRTGMFASPNIIKNVRGNQITISFFEFGKSAKITQTFTVCEDQTIAK